MSSQIFTHSAPLLRDEANYIFLSNLPDGSAEQLWGRKDSDSTVELCCIPFFLYNVSLRDIIQLNDEGRMAHVLRSSGRLVARVWFGDKPERAAGTADALTNLGAGLEWSSANLLAVDAPPNLCDQVMEFLVAGHSSGDFMYENGRQPRSTHDTSR
jgi:hypothetical protein